MCVWAGGEGGYVAVRKIVGGGGYLEYAGNAAVWVFQGGGNGGMCFDCGRSVLLRLDG